MAYYHFRADDGSDFGSFEVFALDGSVNDDISQEDGTPYKAGWYWWACFPGCLPEGEPWGPFGTEQDAITDARDL